jgi:hypothetical protein
MAEGRKFLFVKIGELMQEHDLQIDDVRWYLASAQAERLLTYRDKKRELIRLIWSGALLAELQSRLDRGTRDEAQVRAVLREIVSSRENRYTRPS